MWTQSARSNEPLCVVNDAIDRVHILDHYCLDSAIGRAAALRPALSKEVDNHTALLDLLKGIVADLDLSVVLLKCFHGQFAPYRNEREFRSWVGVLGLHPTERHPVAEGREGQALRGMRDRQLPLSQRRALRVRSGLRARHRDGGAAAVPGRLPSARGRNYIEHFGLDAPGRLVAIDDDGFIRSAYPTETECLVEEMLGTAGRRLPDTPVLLGEFPPDAAEAMGAIHDEALADAPELRPLGRPYRRGR
ncbi:MAG: hypothetical protein OXC19_19210 [Bryobacterales bacterium]|nr:hypothetical protein [Bryobacterales bacterium]